MIYSRGALTPRSSFVSRTRFLAKLDLLNLRSTLAVLKQQSSKTPRGVSYPETLWVLALTDRPHASARSAIMHTYQTNNLAPAVGSFQKRHVSVALMHSQGFLVASRAPEAWRSLPSCGPLGSESREVLDLAVSLKYYLGPPPVFFPPSSFHTWFSLIDISGVFYHNQHAFPRPNHPACLAPELYRCCPG